MSTSAMETYVQSYETRMKPVRDRFMTRLAPMFAEKDPRVLGLFLINFCAQGVGMTEPVPDWIRRSGEQTVNQGYAELGTALINHAVHEAGHHEMMIHDTRSLVGWWNDFQQPKLSADTFLKQSYSPGVMRYRTLHEDNINGTTPFCQIAIEYEIEKVSVDCGPMLFGYLAKSLGPKIMECLSFVTEHVAIDVGHTQYNQRALGSFLAKAPHTLDALVQAGEAALDCYGAYLEDAMSMGKKYAKGNA